MATTMAAIASNVTDLVTGSVSWISTATAAVMDQPLLLFFVLIGFVSIGFGLLRRFFA